MVKLSGFVGAVVGFTISVLSTEVIFPNSQEWPIVINAALTAAGALAGVSLARRMTRNSTGSAGRRV